MSYYGAQPTALRKTAPHTAKVHSVPSSVGGINSLDALNMMPPQDCIYTYNLMPVEYGLELRKGFREWANGCGTFDVRTILNYESNKTGIINDRLWAVTAEGIWDVSSFGETTPTQVAVFADQTEPAGYGVKAEFTNDVGLHYMFYADGVNGLWEYSDLLQTWRQPIGGTGPGEWSWDPPGGGADQPFPVENIAFVMLHKQRMWVILEDQDDGWYLPVGAIAGKLERFIFGAKMPRGGRLMGLWNWTIDGGDGVDDYLIAIGRAGDVIVYRGEDPEITASSTGSIGQPWEQAGSWYVGDMTATRRPVVEYGSDMYILSSFGITNIPTLLGGEAASGIVGNPSAKITRFLRRDVAEGISGHGWSLTIHPADGFIQIINPEPSNTPFTQYVQNLTTKAWGLWEGVPILAGEEWNGEYFMGGKAGVVWIYDGGLDGTLLDGTTGQPVAFRTLTSFQVYGSSHATFKRVGFVRTVGVTSGASTFNVQAVYDYDINAIIETPSQLPGESGSSWNSAVWNVDLWAGGLSGSSLPNAASGMGRAIAIGINGSSSNRISVIGWDITVTEGGPL
jgi:hypothetical protein